MVTVILRSNITTLVSSHLERLSRTGIYHKDMLLTSNMLVSHNVCCIDLLFLVLSK